LNLLIASNVEWRRNLDEKVARIHQCDVGATTRIQAGALSGKLQSRDNANEQQTHETDFQTRRQRGLLFRFD
jgi:hypothetical protein